MAPGGGQHPGHPGRPGLPAPLPAPTAYLPACRPPAAPPTRPRPAPSRALTCGAQLAPTHRFPRIPAAQGAGQRCPCGRQSPYSSPRWKPFRGPPRGLAFVLTLRVEPASLTLGIATC